MYAKDPYEAEYQFLINKRESTGLKHFIDPKAFIEYLNDMHDVYENIDEYNMLQRLTIALVQGSNSESLLNEIRQVVYSLYQSKQITKKVYNNIIKFIQL